MTSSPIIFCDPKFLGELQGSSPHLIVLPFSKTIEGCQNAIASLEKQSKREAWMVFYNPDGKQENQPVVDHLNLTKQNPLIGPVDLNLGPRFPDMSSVYEGDEGIIVVQGDDEDLSKFDEPWVKVEGGVWEAIALKHRGYRIQGWILTDVEKWVRGMPVIN